MDFTAVPSLDFLDWYMLSSGGEANDQNTPSFTGDRETHLLPTAKVLESSQSVASLPSIRATPFTILGLSGGSTSSTITC